jgi:hypothetical protein
VPLQLPKTASRIEVWPGDQNSRDASRTRHETADVSGSIPVRVDFLRLTLIVFEIICEQKSQPLEISPISLAA